MLLFYNEEQRLENKKILENIAKLPNYQEQMYKTIFQEVLEKDLTKLKPIPLTKNYLIPKFFGTKTVISAIKTITSLKGNKEKGKQKIALCYSCHKIGNIGVSFGPDLTSWGNQRPLYEIIEAIVEPSKKLAHGYEKSVRVTSDKGIAEGLLVSNNYHAGTYKLKIFGGSFLTIAFRHGRPKSKLEKLKKSWMPSAENMGLSNQDVRDIAEFLKTQ